MVTQGVRRGCKRRKAGFDGFVVGTSVRLLPYGVSGIVIDVVLDDALEHIRYAIVAFDSGPGGAVVYQPIRWNLLFKAQGGFVVNAHSDAIVDDLPDALLYGGNSSNFNGAFAPTPQSLRVH
jgi:hypothetical protein